MKQWILNRVSRLYRERADLTLQAPSGEVQEPETSRRFLEQERALIEARKKAAGCHEPDLVGLALSGGGIRSAAFTFGVLEVLERQDLTKHVDYLSTVSGGGYTGTAYSGWRLRQALYAERSTRAAAGESLQVKEAPPARWDDLLPHLRNFSNYISPVMGLASGGTWRIIGTLVRNLTIHWLALASGIVVAFALVLLTLRFLWALSLGVAAFAFVQIAIGLVQEFRARRYYSKCRDDTRGQSPGCEELAVNVRRLLQEPRLRIFTGLGAYALAAALWFVSTAHPAFPRDFGEWFKPATIAAQLPLPESWQILIQQYTYGAGSGWMIALIIAFMSALLVGAIGFVSEWRWRKRRNFWPQPSWVGLVFVVALVLLTWAILAVSNGYFTAVGTAETLAIGDLFWRATAWSIASAWDYVWETSLVMVLFALLAAVIIAILNEQMDREEREWTTRIVATSLAMACGWIMLAGLVLLSCRVAEIAVFSEELSAGAIWSGLGLSGAWLALSGLAARLGKTATVREVLGKYWKRIVAAIGPTVFAVGLVLLVCFAAAAALMKAAPLLIPALDEIPAAYRGATILWSGEYVLAMFGIAAVVFLISGIILDPNEFSLHGFYRDRLVRCFLGASNRDNPAPNSLWNIRTDDFPLVATQLAVERYGAPLQLVNTAVNLFGSKDLRVQRRRCDSFVLTPLGCGSRATNYAPTPPRLYLGTAMAISGAAVSPNMGLQTRDAGLAAVMTFFNVRLGYWFGNPRMNVPGRYRRPLFAPKYLLAEALAHTNEDRQFVNLSDGGHFENLGLYELLRRRCRFIIAVDAECDPQYRCTSLAWLVRMARIDLGVEIDIDIESLCDPKTQLPRALKHWLLGEVWYPPVPGERTVEHGHLLYIKSSLLSAGKNSDLGPDVIEYSRSHPDFPHESTADQFFNEAQFEAYRMLGASIAAAIFRSERAPVSVASMFERLGKAAGSATAGAPKSEAPKAGSTEPAKPQRIKGVRRKRGK
ncbi:MAG TPA: patatin-like phospholipase family protein [Burkholderiales bacterium]